MRCVIVDDEPLARVELRRLLRSHPNVEIVGEAGVGEDALGLIRRLAPDLLFLDIEMPGMNGFELLEELEGGVPQVVFTTAYDHHAIRAFEFNALDYLLKPIIPERLADALSRGRRLDLEPALSRMFVRDGERCWIVPLADVFLFESEGNYSRVCFGSERPLIRRSLSALEATLPPSFFRANRRQIVNLDWIATTRRGGAGAVSATLRCGVTVEFSRRQSDRLRAVLSL